MHSKANALRQSANQRKEDSVQIMTREISVPQVTAEQLAESIRIKHIRKLRWVGMDDEARLLQGMFDPEHADSVLAIPHATD
jgi:hypothetical protein